MKVLLLSFSNKSFDKGAGLFKQILWYYINIMFVRSSYIPFMSFKIFLLRTFGAKIGRNLYIKPGIQIKHPWKLTIGNYCWIGENVWIDNLDYVRIGDNVCISQGALLLTGNHDYSKSSFDYRNAPIILEEGVWVGAKTVVCPGVRAFSHSILTVGSVATKDMEAWSIYQGNPAIKIRNRKIKN